MLSAAGLLVVGLVAGADAVLGPWSLAGAAVAVAAVVLVAVAQLQMGSSWRIGVDLGERTELVRTGLYTEIRNPIYTGMVAFAVGQALLLPSGWTVAAVVAMTVGVQIQVRAVEEPYLVVAHGPAFARWASWPVASCHASAASSRRSRRARDRLSGDRATDRRAPASHRSGRPRGASRWCAPAS